jgi:hypothetical protein
MMSALAQINRGTLLTQLFLDALNRRPLQPLGLLHMERLEMAPVDVERGELPYSLPMSPNEKVTLAHKEWTVTQIEYTKFIEDSLENFSETGVSQSTDLPQSTSTQTQHTNSLSMGESPTVTNSVGVTPPGQLATSRFNRRRSNIPRIKQVDVASIHVTRICQDDRGP